MSNSVNTRLPFFKTFSSATTLAVLLTLAATVQLSCRSTPKGEAKLSAADVARLTEYARAFLLRSKIDMGEGARRVIAATPPQIRSFVERDGTGRISLSWTIDDDRVVKVFGTGNLDEVTDCSWRVSIINMKRALSEPAP